MAQNASSAPQQIVRRDLLTAALDAGARIDRVEIKRIDLAPGQPTGLHRHPCPVVGTIVAGTILFQIDGQAAKTLQAGDALFEPANVRILHFDNPSMQQSASFIAMYLLGGGERRLIEML